MSDYVWYTVPPPLIPPDSQTTFSQINNDIKILGDMLVEGTVQMDDVVTIANTTQSTGITTGALVVSGGVGIAKQVYIGSSTASTNSSTGALVVSGSIGSVGLYSGSNVTVVGNISASGSVSSAGLRVTEGSNAKQGTGTLASGVATVSNTSVTANSRIFLTPTSGAVGTVGSLAVVTKNAGSNFIVVSSLVANDTFNYEIFEPNA